jgi:hypothetical protein
MDDLKQKIMEKLSNDGKLACKDAFKIAEQFNIDLASVGEECNKMNIKIMGCQLGCF